MHSVWHVKQIVNDRNRNQNRNHSGSVIFTETGMGSHSSIHSKMTLTARSKNFGISIILHKNLLNRVISLYCRKNLPLFFFKYIASSEILKIFTILFRYWVSVPVQKKSIFRFRSGFGEIPFSYCLLNKCLV